MSTRANITITHGDTRTILYRHCDGYPSCTGLDLAQTCMGYDTIAEAKAKARSAGSVLVDLLSQRTRAYTHRDASPIYEVTSCIHGDIEHSYVLKTDDFGRVVGIAHQAIPLSEDGPRPWKDYTPEEFEKHCLAEKAVEEARYAARIASK